MPDLANSRFPGLPIAVAHSQPVETVNSETEIASHGQELVGVLIHSGSFLTGTTNGLPLEQPVHRVEIE